MGVALCGQVNYFANEKKRVIKRRKRQTTEPASQRSSLLNVNRKPQMVIQVKRNQRIDLPIVQFDRSLGEVIEGVQLARRHHPAKNVSVIPHRRRRNKGMRLIG